MLLNTALFHLFSCSVVSDSFVTPMGCPAKAPLSMEFSRQEYWSGLPFPSAGVLPTPGMEPECPAGSPVLQADSLPPAQLGKP